MNQVHVVRIPYQNNEYYFEVFVPQKRKSDLANVEKLLKTVNFIDLNKEMASTLIELILPKFKIESKIVLDEPLKKVS